MDTNFRNHGSFKDFIMESDYKDMVSSGTGIFGCKGCNTRCYVWDKDFERKVNSPSFMERLLPKIVADERKKLIEKEPLVKSHFDPAVIKSINEKRPVYIWGGGRGGIYTYRTLHANGIAISGFVDNNSEKWGDHIGKHEVFGPPVLENYDGEQSRPYVIVGSQFTSEISHQLEQLGYTKERDYQTFTIQ